MPALVVKFQRVFAANVHVYPLQRYEAPVACPNEIYNNRNPVEHLWARLKEWRVIATSYEKTAVSFIGGPLPPPPSIGSSDHTP